MFKRKIKSLFGVMLGAVLLCVSAVLGARISLRAYTADDLNSELVSVFVKDTQNQYVYGTSPSVQVITDEVFPFKVTVKNTGAAGWHGTASLNDTSGAALMSYNDDSLDKTFGSFFVLVGQGTSVAVSQEYTFNTLLKAPSETGSYTMRWRQADWPNNTPSSFPNKDAINFFGDEIVIDVQVSARTEQAPEVQYTEGVLNITDFTYEGTFKLPKTTYSPAYTGSGLTLRTVNGEKRLIYYEGNKNGKNTGLNEIAVPETLGKIVNGTVTEVTAAVLRTSYTTHPLGIYDRTGDWRLGGIWYDQETELFYWTNFNTYYQNGIKPEEPILYWGRFEGNALVKEGEWAYPAALEGPFKSYWRGVTGVPESLSDSDKFKGKELVLGFGGLFSGNAYASSGPALGAVSTDNTDLTPVMYYAGGSSTNTENLAVRDGNYFDLYNKNNIPASPWEGKWNWDDSIDSGVFIDLPDKKGYLTFVNQAKGRSAYDYGGPTYLGERQHSWYFYDFETLQSEEKLGLAPSSYSVFETPKDSRVTSNSGVTGSCFDPDTRLLYLMIGSVFWGEYENQPAVHVYRVTGEGENTDGPYPPSFTNCQKEMNLSSGYTDIATPLFRILGEPAAEVEFESDNDKITWNSVTKQIEVEAGLAAGTYSATLTASNGVSPDAVFNFTLTVNGDSAPPPVSGQQDNKPNQLLWKRIGVVAAGTAGGIIFLGGIIFFVRKEKPL